MSSVVEPQAAARAWREELGLDYGKIDYTVREGQVVLLDANKTTGRVTYLTPGDAGGRASTTGERDPFVLRRAEDSLACRSATRRHTPTQGGVRVPSALAIEASGRPVTSGRKLGQNLVPDARLRHGSGTSAPQAQHGLELLHAEQAAHAEERGVTQHEPGAE